jgi:hypothetical protein
MLKKKKKLTKIGGLRNPLLFPTTPLINRQEKCTGGDGRN